MVHSAQGRRIANLVFLPTPALTLDMPRPGGTSPHPWAHQPLGLRFQRAPLVILTYGACSHLIL
jgi:hypothetical protein